ncbi:MAG: hypothetical protein R3E32_06400 [Chitinophagales bacterium]
MTKTLQELFDTLPQVGRVTWIGIRPEKRGSLQTVESVEADTEQGLLGDHYGGGSGKRQVTLIQGEHLDSVASMLGLEVIDPLLTRRNIVVRGINLLALKEKQFRIGEAVLETTGLVSPLFSNGTKLGRRWLQCDAWSRRYYRKGIAGRSDSLRG